jgi:hypothetical protein
MIREGKKVCCHKFEENIAAYQKVVLSRDLKIAAVKET